MTLLKKPMSVGEFIKLAFLDSMDMTATKLANNIGVSVSTVTRILNGKSKLTCSMAIKLEKHLGRSAESWMNLEKSYQLYTARNK